MFVDDFLTLQDGRKIHYAHSAPAGSAHETPVIALHGLGSSLNFWLPALELSGLTANRDVYAYDFDGHGLSDFSNRTPDLNHLVDDLGAILDVLQIDKAILLGHSMNGTVTSLFAERHPDKVEKLILLHPVRNMAPAAREVVGKRADAASSIKGLSTLANTVSSTAVAKSVAASDHTCTAFIRHLVSTTKPEAYAWACRALSAAPTVDATKTQCEVHLIGGEEDYLAGPDALRAWAAEIADGKGSATILKNVGHWGAVEAPLQVAKVIAQAMAPTSYDILLSTFRSPVIYTLRFDVKSGKLELQHTNEAIGGHSWMDVSPDRKTLYTTVWSETPCVASYDIIPKCQNEPVKVQHQQTIPSKLLSGYVCSNNKAMYSACGPQVDVFLLDEKTGQVKGPAAQSFTLVSEEERHKGNGTMDFGGLRHGGHSADLSPDGTKLYVADIGRNCVWMYHVDKATGRLTEASKNIAKREAEGPRHAWPHPNGKIVYSLQEHSSYVDVLRLSADDQTLEWVEGGNILPEGDDMHDYWADEVRLSPLADVVFGSTRGLKEGKRGWVTAWRLRPDGTLAEGDNAAHRFETRTSGGWANAIAVCPNLGPKGEVFITLTDSEACSVSILSYTDKEGFTVLDELKVNDDEHGSAVTVWL